MTVYAPIRGLAPSTRLGVEMGPAPDCPKQRRRLERLRRLAGGAASYASPRLLAAADAPKVRRRFAAALRKLWPRGRILECAANERLPSLAERFRADFILVDWREAADNALELARALRCSAGLGRVCVAAVADAARAEADEPVVVVARPLGLHKLQTGIAYCAARLCAAEAS